MSSINGIFGNGFNVGQVSPFSSTNRTGGGADSDGDNDRSRVGSRGNAFASAITQALSQIGVSAATASNTTGTVTSPTSGSASSTTTQDPQQALSAFMHDLFAALQGQGGQQTAAAPTAGTDSDGDNDGSSTSAATGASGKGHHHHGGGIGGVESKLNNLIQQLTSANSTSGTTSGTSSASDASVTALQQGFQNLLAASGASGNQTTLANFLQALSQNLQGNNPGLNVSTKV